MKKYLILFSFMFATNVYAADLLYNELPQTQVANLLGWTYTSNLCQGYYQEPSIVVNYPKPAPIKQSKTTVVAQKSVSYSQKGDSILTGNVIITQPGREVIADKVVLHRDQTTQKIGSADLYGNVHFREYGKVLIGKYGHLDFINNTISIDNAIYHLGNLKQQQASDVWGRVSHITRDQNQILTMNNASYTSCQPATNAWHITGKKLIVNKNTGLGTATNAILYAKDTPIFYWPYFQFPVDKRRRTGFLFPKLAYTKDGGFDVALPLYLNLAPNYDATYTPRYMSKRGLLNEALFRYLTPKSAGKIYGDFIFNDRAFKKFQKSALTDYPNDPALHSLENSSDNRGEISWQNSTQFNPNWSSNIDVNYVTDNYFLRDFGDLPNEVNQDQLLNRVNLNFENDTWHITSQVQGFQTLQKVGTEIQDQYAELPALFLAGDFPDTPGGIDYRLNASSIYFEHEFRSIYPPYDIYPIGERFNIQPGAELPLSNGTFFVTPKVQAAGTFYYLSNYANPVTPALQNPHDTSKDLNRVLPIIDIDSGMVLERDMKLFGSDYNQTLEPRLFYLYVPYVKQDDIPNFDTDLSVLNFENLFRTNRFSSIDKIGDADQVTAALTSRILDSNTGAEKIRGSIGEIYAFQRHRVCLNPIIVNGQEQCQGDSLEDYNLSPIYSELSYYFNRFWNVTGDLAWNVNTNNLNSTNVTFAYKDDVSRIFNIGYNYLVDGDNFNGKVVNLNRFLVSSAIPLTQHWQLFGEWNYNISYNTAQSYLGGLEYNSCCWAIRLFGSHVYKENNQFDNTVAVQFLFKGLGTVSSQDIGNQLTTNIPGYKDTFK
jgi:LPS-assembly protein